MTYAEYFNLKVGDTVYYVNVEWRRVVIEPRKILSVGDFVCSWPRMASAEGSIFKTWGVEQDMCFMTLNEACDRLKELIDINEKVRRKNYDLVGEKHKRLYVTEVVTI